MLIPTVSHHYAIMCFYAGSTHQLLLILPSTHQAQIQFWKHFPASTQCFQWSLKKTIAIQCQNVCRVNQITWWPCKTRFTVAVKRNGDVFSHWMMVMNIY